MRIKKLLRYSADILTLMRFLLSIYLIVLGIVGGEVKIGFLAFMLAELTDAFDGTCSRKWPFPKGQTPKYRKWAVKYDMLADCLLWFSAVLFLTLRVSSTIGLSIMIGTTVIASVLEIVIYGKFFGHPDDCVENSLCAKDFKTAKKLVMLRRWFYLFTVILVAVDILIMSEWSRTTQFYIIGVGILVLVFLWFFLETRRKNISRNAIELEERMLKK